jgi:hypothetical protein
LRYSYPILDGKKLCSVCGRPTKAAGKGFSGFEYDADGQCGIINGRGMCRKCANKLAPMFKSMIDELADEMWRIWLDAQEERQ